MRIATPDNEADLVEMALHATGAQVSKTVRLTRRALAAAEADQASRRHAYRRASWSYEDDGSMTLRCTLPPETAARVSAALDTVMDRLEAEEPPDAEALEAESYPRSGTAVPFDLPAPRGTRRADALVWIAERVLAGGAMPPELAASRHEIVVHVDAGVLKHRGAGRCEAEDGPALAAETARRIPCDCAVVPVVENDAGEPLSVGRRTRSIPTAMRRALQSRDRGCRFPGCGATYRLHGHHVRHWADGGETALDNLVLLCPFHHRLVHEGGFEVERLDDGALRFVRPGGTPLRPPDAGQGPGPVEALLESNAGRGVTVDAGTCVARWDGWPVDYDLGVCAFVQGLERARERLSPSRGDVHPPLEAAPPAAPRSWRPACERPSTRFCTTTWRPRGVPRRNGAARVSAMPPRATRRSGKSCTGRHRSAATSPGDARDASC